MILATSMYFTSQLAKILIFMLFFSFLVGGDGNVYEGASWHKVGAHTRGYNSRSLGLAFIGDFTSIYYFTLQLYLIIKFTFISRCISNW